MESNSPLVFCDNMDWNCGCHLIKKGKLFTVFGWEWFQRFYHLNLFRSCQANFVCMQVCPIQVETKFTALSACWLRLVELSRKIFGSWSWCMACNALGPYIINWGQYFFIRPTHPVNKYEILQGRITPRFSPGLLLNFLTSTLQC